MLGPVNWVWVVRRGEWEDLVMATNAVVARRRLAQGLRRYRQRAGLTIEDLARHLECSVAKVSRMETGISGIRVQDLTAIVNWIQVTDAERRDLEELVRRARGREWWQEFGDLVPAGAGTFYGLEDGASTIRLHGTSLVPGLLQTRGYAGALLGSMNGTDPDVHARRVALRMRRGRVLERSSPPRLTAVLDQAVLYREIGGPEVMADQWRHLLDRAAGAGVVVRVVPFAAPPHPADGLTFTIFDFDHPDLTAVVYAEQLSRNTFIEEPREVGVYEAALARAEGAALPADESLELIDARLRALG
ncbi:helix-turn-helix domain-containing protein [Frankia nepalensis]|nr:helix-turn-helix transcriptional regulator [Frankia nepalensis]